MKNRRLLALYRNGRYRQPTEIYKAVMDVMNVTDDTRDTRCKCNLQRSEDLSIDDQAHLAASPRPSQVTESDNIAHVRVCFRRLTTDLFLCFVFYLTCGL